MNIDNYTAMVFLVLLKPFATSDRSILLMKLGSLVLNDNSVDWFQAYFANRRQLGDVHDTLSDSRNIAHWASQGSPFGPLIYMHNAERPVDCKLVLRAIKLCWAQIVHLKWSA